MGQVLIVVAQVKAKKESVDLVKAELLKLVEPTRKEDGCIQYDIHQDNESPELFLFYEKWETKNLWLAHRVNTHLLHFRNAIEGAVEFFTANEMTIISDDGVEQ